MSESVWVIKEIRRDTIALSIAIAVFLVASYEILGRNAFDEATLRLSTSYALVAGGVCNLNGLSTNCIIDIDRPASKRETRDYRPKEHETSL